MKDKKEKLKKLRKQQLIEEVYYQKIFNHWVWSDVLVACTTMAGFLIAFFYHIHALYQLQTICLDQGVSSPACHDRLYLDRFPDTMHLKWLIVILNIASVLVFIYS